MDLRRIWFYRRNHAFGTKSLTKVRCGTGFWSSVICTFAERVWRPQRRSPVAMARRNVVFAVSKGREMLSFLFAGLSCDVRTTPTSHCGTQ